MPSVSDITLRAMEPEDLELIYRIENDPAFWRYGTTTVPYSRWTLRRYIESAANDLFADEQVRMVVQGKTEQGVLTTIGLADLVNFSPRHHRAEISLAILPEFQGMHTGEHIVRQLIAYARSLGLHQLYAIIAETNVPAWKLFKRLNFQPSALLKDWLYDEERYTDARVWQLDICS